MKFYAWAVMFFIIALAARTEIGQKLILLLLWT